jgi:hypothetical protein
LQYGITMVCAGLDTVLRCLLCRDEVRSSE